MLDPLQFFGRCRLEAGDADLGLIFTSKGGVMQLEGQIRHTQAARLAGSDTYGDKGIRLMDQRAFLTLLSKTQDANHQFCNRKFLGDHNQGAGKGVRCRDVPTPKTQLCQGCVNKETEDKCFRNHYR